MVIRDVRSRDRHEERRLDAFLCFKRTMVGGKELLVAKFSNSAEFDYIHMPVVKRVLRVCLNPSRVRLDTMPYTLQEK